MKCFYTVVAAVIFSTPALADIPSVCDAAHLNPVVNCGFETGDLTGWFARPAGMVAGSNNGLFAPHSGNYYLQIDAPTEDVVSATFPVSGAPNANVGANLSGFFISNGSGFFCITVNVAQVFSDFPSTCADFAPNAGWQEFQMPTILNPGDAYIQVISIDFTPGSVGRTVGFDDFIVTPEPGDSLRLLLVVALGILLCAARFRSRGASIFSRDRSVSLRTGPQS